MSFYDLLFTLYDISTSEMASDARKLKVPIDPVVAQLQREKGNGFQGDCHWFNCCHGVIVAHVADSVKMLLWTGQRIHNNDVDEGVAEVYRRMDGRLSKYPR